MQTWARDQTRDTKLLQSVPLLKCHLKKLLRPLHFYKGIYRFINQSRWF